jgi:hypothetical protein
MWLDIRNNCEGLLSADALTRYQELCKLEVFNRDGDDNRDWENLIDKCNSDDEEIDIDDYERQISLRNDFENRSDDVRNKLIAYDQLRAWALYVKHKPVEMAAYRKFLVSICFLYMQCNIVVTILSHYLFYRCITVMRRLQKGCLGIRWYSWREVCWGDSY